MIIPRIMKSKLVRSFLAVAVLGVIASLAYAGPGPQYWQTLRKPDDFKKLKAGEKVAFVCNQCKTVSEVTVASPAHAMEQCKEGATVTCPSCNAKTKVVVKRQRNDPPTREELVYVNDKGEECAFFAKPGATK